MKRILAILMLVVMSVSAAARAEEGPREYVTGYMQALQARDYGKALKYVGIELPPEALSAIEPMLEKQSYFTWAVKGFRVVDVRQDGGLALVTVEETQFKDIAKEGRAFLEGRMPVLSKAIVWGDNVVKERFVLVRLDGRWQFDSGHSGVQYGSLMTLLVSGAAKGGDPLKDESAQKALGAFINQIGFGQLLQSFGGAAPVAPLFAAIAIPNFVRARAMGVTTACKSNLKNLGTALEMYSTDNNGLYPTTLSKLSPDYLKIIPTCPAAKADTYSRSFQSAAKPDAYTVFCEGHNHQEAGLGANYPQYTSTQGLRD